MHLIQILLPLNDGEGRPFPADVFERLAHELTEKFGGVTSFTRSPAEGRWKSGQSTERDDIAVIEVMAETVERDYWAEMRRRLEDKFKQDEVIIRCQRTETL
jgi:hypothetical protein